jgi:hypothetical protein
LLRPTCLSGFGGKIANVGVASEHLLSWLADTRLARQLLEAVFRIRARRQVNRLDQPPERAQVRTLLGLVHQAQKTAFGREHDFRRIRTVADFRRLVPLTTLGELAQQYWRPHPAPLSGTTWPTLGSGRVSAMTEDQRPQPFVPVSPASQGAHRAALRTAFGLAIQARPRARLLSGQVLHLSETSDTALPERIPHVLRPYTHTSSVPDTALRDLAQRYVEDNVTCLVGPADRIAALIEHVRQVRGGERLEHIWPKLSAILYTRSAEGAAEQLGAAVGGETGLLEMLLRPEGPIAVEDPRPGGEGGLRLLTDHGAFFEFVPAGAAGPRLGLEEVQCDEPYEVALTSPAGLWACRLGLVVALARLAPPILRVLASAPSRALAVTPTSSSASRADGPMAARPPRANHQQNGGTPAAPPGNFSHSPWSVPVDRG